jgi:hypothetical protein
MVERLDVGLQEQVCPAFGSLQRLSLHKALAEHEIDGRLDGVAQEYSEPALRECCWRVNLCSSVY